jgi:site-specific DNA-methyltransferase (adenine-specific)
MTTLLKGDCLTVMKGMFDKSVDCFVCDLPYGCLTGGGGKEKAMRKEKGSGDSIAGCSWDVKIDLVEFWKQVKRLARNDHTPVLMFCNTRFGAELITSNPDWFRYDLVWNKELAVGFLSANKQPLRSHELIYVFSKKGAYYKRVDIEVEGAKEWKQFGKVETDGVYNLVRENPVVRPVGTITSKAGIRCVKSVIEISNKKGRGNHPTAKPAELYKWLLERYCPPGGTMLDPTAGSFNSVFTATEMGIHAIGIEMNDAFFWKAVGKSANAI